MQNLSAPQLSVSDYSKRGLPWIVCLSAALFFFYEFIQLNMFNAISADLMHDFGLHATKLGRLSAFYFYANLLFLPVAGALLDRFSTRRIILIALFLCIIGVLGFAKTHSFALACFFRFMSGIGSAFCFLSTIRLASRWFPIEKMALVTGLIVTMAMFGGMVAQTPLTLLAETLGWRNTLLIDAGLGLLIFVVIFFLVQDKPPEKMENEGAGSSTAPHPVGLLKGWQLAYLNRQNLLCGLYTCLANLPMALFGALWGSLFLEQTANFSATQASFAPSILFLGAIIGGPVVGWISDKMARRIPLMRWGAFVSLLIVFFIIRLPQFLSFPVVLTLFFALGFFTSSQVLSYPLVAESNPKHLTATSVSVVSFFAIGGYAVFQPLFGRLMDWTWKGTVKNQVSIYSLSDYHHALIILPIGFLIALLATLWLKEG